MADASLVLGWLLDEPQHAPANDVFERLLKESLLVPANWSAEIGNGLRKAWRTGRVREDEVLALVRRMEVFEIAVAPPTPVGEIAALTRFAYEYRLSTYDAGYLRLAVDRRLALATVDGGLRSAAARIGVELLPD